MGAQASSPEGGHGEGGGEDETKLMELEKKLLAGTDKLLTKRLLENTERQEGITKAAWQLEDAMNGRLVKDYPSDLRAREAFFDWSSANKGYGWSIMGIYVLSMIETPAWCNNTDNFWGLMDPGERCGGKAFDDLLLSTVPYLPPGWTLAFEGFLIYQIAVKILLERNLQVQHFSPLHVEYFGPLNNKLIVAGLAMVAFEMADMVVFILFRNPFRLAFIPRTAFMVFLPQVLNLLSSIVPVMQEVGTIAVFFVSGILLFAWIATMLFDGLEGEVFGEEVTKGFNKFGSSVNAMFVAGATDDFFAVFRNTYTEYRVIGILWLVFLVIVHVLLLSLVLDTLVSAYTKLTEENEEECNAEKVDGIEQAFNTLAGVSEGATEITKETFMDFAAEFSRSPVTVDITKEQAVIIFDKVDADGQGTISKEEFFEICGVMALEFTIAKKDSPVKEQFPELWNNKKFEYLRELVESGKFDDWFMNAVLIVNLMLVVIETTYDLDHLPEPKYCKKLELMFSFIYLTECGLKLCVWSWQEYSSLRANIFDFTTTWLLLGSSILEEVAGSAGALKRYMNVLRLLRLVRVIKQLKKIPQVIFMVSTISRLVTEAKDILTLLLVVMYFFTMLSVQLFGGLLYKSNPALRETEYSEADYWVLNFNDFLMAFGAWVVMLLCEYKAEFTDAISRTSRIPYSWFIFFIFYVFAVSIIFELVKAFTIEVFVALHTENHKEQKKKKERKDKRMKAIKKARKKSDRQLPDETGCLHGVCSRLGRKDQQGEEASEFTVMLQPGKLGMKHNKDVGRVDEVHEGAKGGEAQACGIEVGMTIIKINGEEYSDEKLNSCVHGTEPYTLTLMAAMEEQLKGLTNITKKLENENPRRALHWRIVGDVRGYEKLQEIIKEKKEEGEEHGEGSEHGEHGEHGGHGGHGEEAAEHDQHHGGHGEADNGADQRLH
mmetsp:Transcript_52735/g.83705  ORF Transcript_52735/g.83705 Transcript_52735/m.83705 type:complete len:943 (-) Transcript_52735:164-2992(-)